MLYSKIVIAVVSGMLHYCHAPVSAADTQNRIVELEMFFVSYEKNEFYQDVYALRCTSLCTFHFGRGHKQSTRVERTKASGAATRFSRVYALLLPSNFENKLSQIPTSSLFSASFFSMSVFNCLICSFSLRFSA
mmetsp:Transcript_18449/g.45287  ORF Transcript_18449/g.45287 Transcript_18449/m.45287 type:complete len:134 (-) Transcript_18449:1181-1582(-)